jgi:YD repeat-containing protein
MEVIVVRKIFAALFSLVVLIVLQGILDAGLAAQSPGSCLHVSSSLWFLGDPIPAGLVCGPGEGPFSTMCIGYTNSCPPARDCPTCNSGGSSGNVPVGGAPINLTTGNTYIQETDVKLPGLGGGLILTRTWNSTWPSTLAALQVGLFGPNWRSNYEERVFLDTDGYMKYVLGDRGFWVFSANGGSNWKLSSPGNVVATLSQGSPNWTLAFQNGEQRLFSVASGSLVSIIDRNGNTTSLTYDATNRLTTVTDPASRHLTFNYPNGSSRLVSSVTSADVSGLSIGYQYDAQNRLSIVTEQDGSTLTFHYDANSLIASVTDSQSKVLESHTYDTSGRGLTSSRANGVEAVTITYPH